MGDVNGFGLGILRMACDCEEVKMVWNFTEFEGWEVVVMQGGHV